MGVDFETEALAFQRDGAATREGVEQFWRIITCRFQDFFFRSFEYLRVIGILPNNKVFENLEKTLTFFILSFFRGKQFWMGRWCIH